MCVRVLFRFCRVVPYRIVPIEIDILTKHTESMFSAIATKKETKVNLYYYCRGWCWKSKWKRNEEPPVHHNLRDYIMRPSCLSVRYRGARGRKRLCVLFGWFLRKKIEAEKRLVEMAHRLMHTQEAQDAKVMFFSNPQTQSSKNTPASNG